MLIKEFDAVLSQASSIVAQNAYLTHLKGAVVAVEDALPSAPELQDYVNRLLTLLRKPNFAVDPLLANTFAQILGEAHFWIMCQHKGVTLRRIPEERFKTPDFEAQAGGRKLYFEVKTLSVVGGDYGIMDALNSSLDANLDLEQQSRQGKKISMATSVAQPYGQRPYKEGTLLAVINTLIEKASQNIKQDQFGQADTFLVLNLSIIPPSRTEPQVLRPSYPDDYQFNTAVTGELWAMAFGTVGMLVQNITEFEGLPCVEGILDKLGILRDDNFECVAGVLFMVHPWNEPSQIWGLYRRADMERWNDTNEELVLLLRSLTDNDHWNDCGDSNAWKLSPTKQ